MRKMCLFSTFLRAKGYQRWGAVTNFFKGLSDFFPLAAGGGQIGWFFWRFARRGQMGCAIFPCLACPSIQPRTGVRVGKWDIGRGHTSCRSLLRENLRREDNDFPCTFSGSGNAPSEGKSREIPLIFCNGSCRSSVGGNSTDYPHFAAVFAVFWISTMRLDSCNALGRDGWVLKDSLHCLRTRDEGDVKR